MLNVHRIISNTVLVSSKSKISVKTKITTIQFHKLKVNLIGFCWLKITYVLEALVFDYIWWLVENDRMSQLFMCTNVCVCVCSFVGQSLKHTNYTQLQLFGKCYPFPDSLISTFNVSFLFYLMPPMLLFKCAHTFSLSLPLCLYSRIRRQEYFNFFFVPFF